MPGILDIGLGVRILEVEPDCKVLKRQQDDKTLQNYATDHHWLGVYPPTPNTSPQVQWEQKFHHPFYRSNGFLTT